MKEVNLENRNRYALITGATSGIGYELTLLFAADGYNLILVARHQERLQEITDKLKKDYTVEVTPLAKDLFQPGAAKEVYDEVKQLGITVNVLVNDAGQGEWGPFIETPLGRDVDIIQLNIISLLTLTKLFARDMVSRNEGKILQVGSEAGTTPVPLLAVYAATKAFVLSFSTALADELKDTAITITVLLPGATDTDFFHKASQEDTIAYREKSLDSPQKVARDGYDALMKGENKIISGARTKLHVFMNDLLGAKKSASTNRKSMESSEKENGRTESSHEPSLEERNFLTEEEERKERTANAIKKGII